MKSIKQIVLILLFTVAVLTGCSKLNRDNFDKIKVGMDYQQVIEIIGQPTKCDGAFGAKKCIWGNEKRNITIAFIAEKVAIPAMKGL